MDARTSLLLSRTARRKTTSRRPTRRPTTRPTPIAGVAPTCCGPCEDQGYCRDDNNCCLECHFGYEELHAFRYLPPEGQNILALQHAWLIEHGFPHEELEEHAQYEMEWFRRFCPEWVISQIEADHDEYHQGRLLSREPEIAAAQLQGY